MAKLTLFYKGRPIKSFSLESKRITIGRSHECDIVIDALAVEPRHALIESSGSNHHISSLQQRHRLIINHQESDRQRLNHGDIIQLGPYSLSYAESAVTLDFGKTAARVQQAEAPSSNTGKDDDKLDKMVGSLNVLSRSCLQVISGEHLGKTIPLHRSLLRLGLTGNQCAVIAHRSDGYYISHLEGEAPPLVNGVCIDEKSIPLKDGCVVQIGDILLRFHEEIIQAAAI